MSDTAKTLSGPDLIKGVAIANVADGTILLGHAHDEPALLVRRGREFFAIGATCTHYGAPLADGLLVDGCVRSVVLTARGLLNVGHACESSTAQGMRA